MMKKVHLIPKPEGWELIGEANGEPRHVFKDPDDAMKSARHISKKMNGILVVHQKDGQVVYRQRFHNHKAIN